MNTKHKIHDTFNEISKKLKRNDSNPKTYKKLIDLLIGGMMCAN